MGIKITEAYIDELRDRQERGEKLSKYEETVLVAAGTREKSPERQYLTREEIAAKVARGEELTKGETIVHRACQMASRDPARAKDWHKDASQAGKIGGGIAKVALGLLIGLSRATQKRRH